MKNVADGLLALARNRIGDLPPPGPSRWGKTAELATGTALTPTTRPRLDFVQTGVIAEAPTPIALALRFSTDGLTFTPNVPATFGGNLVVDITQTIDMKSGAFRQHFVLAPGDAMPICAVLAMGLNVSVALDAEDVSIFVEAVAAPTTMIDCADVVGPTNATTTPRPFTETAVTRQPVSTSMFQMVAQPRRAYLLIANQSTTRSMFVRLGDGVDATPGAELATIVLPPNSFAGYEVLNYTGIVSMLWDGTDASGYALLTQGFYPP